MLLFEEVVKIRVVKVIVYSYKCVHMMDVR